MLVFVHSCDETLSLGCTILIDHMAAGKVQQTISVELCFTVSATMLGVPTFFPYFMLFKLYFDEKTK